MLEQLKKEVCASNLKLASQGLVIDTWGNVSAIDRASGCVVIKPSGISFRSMKAEQMAVVMLDTGNLVEGKLSPSSDTPTHLVLYRAFPAIGSVAHTHSLFATAWGQAHIPIPALGTTHADYFNGPIPCTRVLKQREIETDYEIHTGHAIVECFAERDPVTCPAVLVANHGPFTWAASPEEAVQRALILEHVARLAAETLRINPATKAISTVLLEKHFARKHGTAAYYGQKTPQSPARVFPRHD